MLNCLVLSLTLASYIRSLDACILISDRKGSRPWGNHQEVTKMFVADSKQFALCGAGNGFEITNVVVELCHDGTVNGNNICDKLPQLVRQRIVEAQTFSNPYSSAVICLVAKKGQTFFAYETLIQGNTFSFTSIPTTHRCLGTEAAKVLGDYFFEAKKINQLPFRASGKLCYRNVQRSNQAG